MPIKSVSSWVEGARVVIMNAEPTPFDAIADAVICEPIGEILPGMVNAAT